MADKPRVFLDTSVLVTLAKDQARLQDLFSARVKERFEFVTDATVFSELALFAERTGNHVPLEKLHELVRVMPPAISDTVTLTTSMQQYRNWVAHSNDVLILISAIFSHCKYLLTYDQKLMAAASQAPTLKVTSPEEFIQTESTQN